MERPKRIIALALALVGMATAASLLAAILIPFPVNLSASVISSNGAVEIISPRHGSRPLRSAPASSVSLEVGDSLHLDADSTAIVSLQAGPGRIVINGPGTLTLLTSARRATLLGHLFASDHFPRRYQLALEQTGATASYVFEPKTFATRSIDLSVRLPESDFVPGQPCWTIIFGDAEPPSVRQYPCAR